MRKLFEEVLKALQDGKDTVLCSVVASSGSTPRGAGARMAVFPDGSIVGTIGGGAVEYRSICRALESLQRRAAFTESFDLSKNDVADIGMICGGSVLVNFEFFPADSNSTGLFTTALQLMEQREDAWLLTKIAGGGACATGLYSSRRGLAAGGGLDTAPFLPLLTHRAQLRREGDVLYYAEPLCRAETVYVFGGGHVSAEVVPLLNHVGFSVVVFEERPEFCGAERFPTAAATVLGHYNRIGDKVTIGPRDYVLILTRGHQGDFDVLLQALQTEASYVGVIGSRHKIAATNQRLLDNGISSENLGRIHTPIGLDIGAETPSEIAVSIAAELIRHRAGKENT